jgi:hypothetical protein
VEDFGPSFFLLPLFCRRLSRGELPSQFISFEAYLIRSNQKACEQLQNYTTRIAPKMVMHKINSQEDFLHTRNVSLVVTIRAALKIYSYILNSNNEQITAVVVVMAMSILVA